MLFTNIINLYLVFHVHFYLVLILSFNLNTHYKRNFKTSQGKLPRKCQHLMLKTETFNYKIHRNIGTSNYFSFLLMIVPRYLPLSCF